MTLGAATAEETRAKDTRNAGGKSFSQNSEDITSEAK